MYRGLLKGVFPFRLSCEIQVKKGKKKSNKAKWEFRIVPL